MAGIFPELSQISPPFRAPTREDQEKRMRMRLCIWIIFFCLSRIMISIPIEEVSFLEQLYHQTNGRDWRWRPSQIMGPRWNFLISSPNPCNTNGSTWQGITCSKPPALCMLSTSPGCTIIDISLPFYHLTGSLPSNWTILSSLTSLVLHQNELTGELPRYLPLSIMVIDFALNRFNGTILSEYGLLSSLIYLTLEGNRLRGPIPSNLGNLHSLTYLELDFNLLSQSLPSELGGLTNLQYLTMPVCQLTGPLPTSFGSLVSLSTLDLSLNSLSGPIPCTIGSMTSLISLVLDYNQFSGGLPNTTSQLTNMAHLSLATNLLSGHVDIINNNLSELTYLSIGYNFFSGSFPSLESSAKLVTLNIDSNEFHGLIPSQLGLLSLIEAFSLNNNMFQGLIPSSIGGLTSVTQFDLSQNALTGSIPSSIGLLFRVTSVGLKENYLTGEVPSIIGELYSLESLSLTDNLFSSSIPCSFQMLSNLSVFSADHNYFTGICSTIQLPSNVEVLDLSHNYISDQLPEKMFASSTSLQVLDLSTNFFYGHLLPFHPLTRVYRMDFGNNHLSGSIPSSLGALSNLHQLNLGSNRFSGKIRDWLWQASNLALVNLDLSSNRLDGQIISELFSLRSLQTLALTSNCFHGSLPVEMCNLKNIVVISMDGLGSASDCPTDITIPWSNLRLNGYRFYGDIPNCLWNLENLTTLSLSGNGLSGTIGKISAGSTLINLTLSHNHLSGTISQSIQNHVFYSLDLSYNKFSGEYSQFSALNENIIPSNSFTRRLILEVNRLSGVFSRQISSTSLKLTLEALNGNIFSCQHLPDIDVDFDSYRCGSSPIDESLIGLGILVSIILLLLFVAISLRSVSTSSPIFQSLNNQFSEIYATALRYYHVDLPALICTLFDFQRFIGTLMFSCLLMMIPIYLLRITDSSYSTHDHLYRWEWTAAYLSGLLPALLLLLSWIVIICVLFYCVRHYLRGILSQQSIMEVKSFKQFTCLAILKYVAFILINIGVMAVVNALYILSTTIELSPTSILFIQIAVALFKTSWNKICLPLLDFSRESHRLRIFVLVLNSIFIPCIATAFASPACFQELIRAPQEIFSSYYYLACKIFIVEDGVFRCLTEQVMKVDVPPFTPTFTYNYLCGSTLLALFLPVYIYLYIIQLLAPIGTVILCRYASYESIHPVLRSTFPGLLWPNYWIKANKNSPTEQESTKFVYSNKAGQFPSPNLLFKVDTMANKFMHDILVMITFGLCCPPLCIAIALSLSLSVLEIHLMTGRFVVMRNYDEDPHDISFEILTRIILDLGPACRNLVWVVVWSSCFFFMFLCWDIAGDEIGLRRSYWVPLISLGFVLMLSCYFVQFPLTQSTPHQSSFLEMDNSLPLFRLTPPATVTTSPIFPPQDNENPEMTPERS